MTESTFAEARTLAESIRKELERVIYGQSGALQSLLICLVVGGHVLLEGVPGVGKTLLVRGLAQALRCSFSRIQFTPDLMPSDITGVNVFNATTGKFEFRKGPLFADLVLADEINRAPAKTQAALLEAMQERQVSVEGKAQPLSPTFTVVATQNPVEYEGTYPLPEAQLDRFLMKILIDYPDDEAERRMLANLHPLGAGSMRPVDIVSAVATPEELIEMRKQAGTIEVDDSVLDYVLRLIRQSRHYSQLALGASPRAAIMLLNAAKALALLRGKPYVTPDEVQVVAMPVLRHRIQLAPEAEIEGISCDDAIASLLSEVVIPR